METINPTRSGSSCGICDECQSQDFANCSWRVEREGVMSEPIRYNGQAIESAADVENLVEELEKTNLWLETTCALLIERLEDYGTYRHGRVIIDDSEIVSGTAPELVTDRVLDDEAWVLRARRPAATPL